MRRLPFTITPDTAFFMNRAGYQDGLNVLLVALRSGEGFVKVTGEVGVGKTMLCRKLLCAVGSDFATAYIHNPYLEPLSLLLAIADELGLDCEPGIDRHTLLKRLTAALMQLDRDGKRVVVCLDEVQAMPVETLETLRLLTNLETEKKKLLQVVLFGQPELDRLLDQPSVRQLKQRITFSYELLPLNRIGLLAYVRHRIGVAGGSGVRLFSKGAIDALYLASSGVPRLVNILCHKALMAAYGQGAKEVGRAHMRRAIEDTVRAQSGGRPPTRWERGARAALLALLGGATLALAAFRVGGSLDILP
jgi:MSHA biogenesis protein MshM